MNQLKRFTAAAAWLAIGIVSSPVILVYMAMGRNRSVVPILRKADSSR